MAQQTTEIPQSENEKVVSWRLHVLMETGYPRSLRRRSRPPEADLHAVELIACTGCCTRRRLRILL
jgi:hypothetical protein